MKKDKIYNGIRVGVHSFEPEKIIDEINERCKEGMNYIAFSTNCMVGGESAVEQKYYIEWAKYLADKKIYFSFDGGGFRNPVNFTMETVRKMKEIAGEYFLSYTFGEVGHYFSCDGAGYRPLPDRVWKDVKEAKEAYVKRVRQYAEENSMGGMLDTSVIEAFTMVMYNSEAGVTYPTMEFWQGDMEIAAAFTRGTASSFNSEKWAAYFAHEWYGGLRYDELKAKRLKMGYDYTYLSGSNVFVNESGDQEAGSHSSEKFEHDHPICQDYRKVMADFAKFTLEDSRPVGGPKVKVAFVYGNLDGYSFQHYGSSLWRGHLQKDFGYSAPEHAWRILEDVHAKRRWCDVCNYGEVDLSGAPAYGQYDVISANAGADVFSKYDYLIFCGWNSMTEKIYKELKTFVERGGRLFMTAAHLNTSVKRDGSISLINGGDVSDLFGCTLDSENAFESENGTKFTGSIVPELLYPSTHINHSDPAFADGYIKHAKASLTSGVATGRLSDSFAEKDEELLPASLIENKCGEGYAILMTSLEYPSGAVAPMYRALVKEILTASHRSASVKVYGGDSLRFSVYEGDKVYLLNTDFDCDIVAIIDYGTHREKFVLEPCEFKIIEKK